MSICIPAKRTQPLRAISFRGNGSDRGRARARCFHLPSKRRHDQGAATLSGPGKFKKTRSWVQDWVQLNDGRMAFPVRKRRQIGHLAFYSYGYEPEGREFESPGRTTL
jgi:hypothetical protein